MPIDVLKSDGVVLFSNANGVYLGDARFDLRNSFPQESSIEPGRRSKSGRPPAALSGIKRR
jgi:hypothetical protein